MKTFTSTNNTPLTSINGKELAEIIGYQSYYKLLKATEAERIAQEEEAYEQHMLEMQAEDMARENAKAGDFDDDYQIYTEEYMGSMEYFLDTLERHRDDTKQTLINAVETLDAEASALSQLCKEVEHAEAIDPLDYEDIDLFTKDVYTAMEAVQKALADYQQAETVLEVAQEVSHD